MDLVAQVFRALDERPVNPAEFELCACALLQARYPGLSPVEGGHDFGRDGDVYFPFGESDLGSFGRFLATTGDPVANLRTGLRRMHEEGVAVDLVVMACLAPVNATTRAKLDKLCADRGLSPPHVYARNWFAGELVREPTWRKRLLGITGELGALLDHPLETLESAAPRSSTLVGRVTERATLDQLVDTATDVVLVGVPGVGKTRLTTELEHRVAFLQSAEPGQVVADLRHTDPQAVVVDDAHDRHHDLQVLRRARIQEGLSFSIIATTWPDQTEAVADVLPGATTVTIDLLEPAEIDTLVQAVGVTGHRARQLIHQQAEGRPGWALALCELIVQGDGHNVVTGAAHLANIERFLRRTTESETALDALACVAALKHASTELVHELAPLVGTAPAALIGMFNRLARNGLLDRSTRGWSLQPALCAPLVARWFFTDPAGRPWSTLLKAFPDHSLPLTDSMIAAAAAGSARARDTADGWAQALQDADRLDENTLTLLGDYSMLSVEAAQLAVEHACAVLATPREPMQILGMPYDPAGRAASKLISNVARQWLLPRAVTAMLGLVAEDPRPRPQNPDHPMRVLTDLTRMIDPDFGTTVEISERLLACALGWLAESPDPTKWTTTAELFAAIFSPEVSGHWPVPGAPDTVSFSEGIDTAANLSRLIELWARVERMLNADHEAEAPVCPPEALALLVDLAAGWLRLGAGFGTGTTGVQDEQKLAGQFGGRRILESLRPMVRSVPGLALRAQRLLDEPSWNSDVPDDPPLAFDIDPDLDAFVGGSRHFGSDVGAELERRAARISDLARRLVELGGEDGAARLAELGRQAQLAGHANEGHAERVAVNMREHMIDPFAWYQAALLQGSTALLQAALAQCLERDPTSIAPDAWTRHLSDPTLRASVLSVVLARSDVDDISIAVLADLNSGDVWLLDRLMVRDTPDALLRHLLGHPVPAIATATALSFSIGQKHGPPLPDDWKPDWRNAISKMRGEDLSASGTWRANVLLGHLATEDPDLFEEWFMRRLDDMSSTTYLRAPGPRGCERHLTQLPQAHRARLARRYASLPGPTIGQSLLTYLIGTDRELAERLIEERAVGIDDVLDVILGQRNAILEQLGPLLLHHGVAPEVIAAHAGVTLSRVGPASTAHGQTIEYFESLAQRVPALLPIAQAGAAQQAEHQQRAAETERQERLRGR
ncbi:hypothetical protein [Amycolatopsis sp. lyj-90]|uniref:hypothetical protein n=1 Tax=Amycolatopsis sp. lyj-90 TaxID=2789285 RepID=UPI00397AE2AC